MFAFYPEWFSVQFLFDKIILVKDKYNIFPQERMYNYIFKCHKFYGKREIILDYIKWNNVS